MTRKKPWARTTKPCPERRKFDALLEDEVKLREAIRELDREAQAEHDAFVAAQEELAQAVEADGLNLDGTAGSERQRKAHEALLRAEARARSSVRKAQRDGLRRRAGKLETARAAYGREHLEALTADLRREAAVRRERLDALLAAVAAERTEWDGLGNAWLALARDSDIGRTTDLSIPRFPIKVGDVVDPVPRVLAEQADVVGVA